MIDTISIYTTDFKVKKDNKLEVVIRNYDKSFFNQKKYFFNFFEDDTSCYAYKVSAEWDNFRINIYNIGNSPLSYRSSLNIAFELPTIFQGFNLNPINFDQINEIKDKIVAALSQVGIVSDINSFKINRIHFFKNILLDHNGLLPKSNKLK